MDPAFKVFTAVVLALSALLGIILVTDDGTGGANIGAGFVALALSLAGLPWSLPVWTGDPDARPGWFPFVLSFASAALNLLLLGAVTWWRRRKQVD